VEIVAKLTSRKK